MDACSSISGEDFVTVDRKFLSAITVKLLVRFLILANDPPALSDAGGALASRYVILRFRKTFLGREDRKLTEKLYGELPGILHWGIAGWRRLQARGYFIEPGSAAVLRNDLRKVSPIPSRSSSVNAASLDPVIQSPARSSTLRIPAATCT